MNRILGLFLLMMVSLSTRAELHSQDIEYASAGEEIRFKGHLVWDDRYSGTLPSVIIVHEWWGLNDYVKLRAQQLARSGYLVMAVDMYGEGKQASHPKQAGQWSSVVRGDPALARKRFEAAMQLLNEHDKARAAAISAIGYCFGGSVVLDMAIQGLPLLGVASFHGGLSKLSPFEKPVTAKVRVFHGKDDSFISPRDLESFDKGMRKHASDYQLYTYEDAVHAFSNPGADRLASQFEIDGLGYNSFADADSWARLLLFLAEIYR